MVAAVGPVVDVAVGPVVSVDVVLVLVAVAVSLVPGPFVPVVSGGGFSPGIAPLVPVTAPTAGELSPTSAPAADLTAVVRVGSRPLRPTAKNAPNASSASTRPATASLRLPGELRMGTSP